jgi:Uma2 family endonuclease
MGRGPVHESLLLRAAMNLPVSTRVTTWADVLHRLGDIGPERIIVPPHAGPATEEDVLYFESLADKRLCELYDGVLVEKAMGFLEDYLGSRLLSLLQQHVSQRRLGIVLGASGMVRLFPGCVRIPDVAVYLWARLPGGKIPTTPLPEVVPNLAVEILSRSNTPSEMERKRRHYFDGGVQALWEIEPRRRTVDVYSSPHEVARLTQADTLRGEPVLPGFALPLAELFAVLDEQAPEGESETNA